MSKILGKVLAMVLLVAFGACIIGCSSQGTATANPDISIAKGQYSEMADFAYGMYEGKYDGKVVHIEGSASTTQTHNIMIMDEENQRGIGVGYIVEGWEDKDYPAQDTRISLTGIVKASEENGNARNIVVSPDNFKTYDSK